MGKDSKQPKPVKVKGKKIDDELSAALLSVVESSKGGRPEEYRPEFALTITKFCLLGCTDEELATRVFGVSLSTYYKWAAEHQEFSDAIKEGREIANAAVANSLYRKAIGYTKRVKKLFMYQGKVIEHEVDEFFPPSDPAIFWFLKNREKDKWKERTDIDLSSGEITVNIGGKAVKKPTE